ncbi:MAG TPA: helix-turn-helix domain-containing protein, partial [Syntrophorhabdaceae bacterium]|nr:helix-turn-helix domain-containing protein [Syntrophorhabdaceae bacterium]
DLPEKLWVSKEKEEQIDIQKGYETLVTEFERAIIMKALKETKGIKSKAASILNMNRTTLIEKMKRLGME